MVFSIWRTWHGHDNAHFAALISPDQALLIDLLDNEVFSRLLKNHQELRTMLRAECGPWSVIDELHSLLTHPKLNRDFDLAALPLIPKNLLDPRRSCLGVGGCGGDGSLGVAAATNGINESRVVAVSTKAARRGIEQSIRGGQASGILEVLFA